MLYQKEPGSDRYLQYLRNEDRLREEAKEKEFLKKKLLNEQKSRFWNMVGGDMRENKKVGNLKDIKQTVKLKDKALKDVPNVFRR